MGISSVSKAIVVIWLYLEYVIYSVNCEENIRVKRAPSNWLSSDVLTESQIKVIVDKHNEMRSKVQPTAAKMLRISWSEELAKIAKDYSKKCEFAHSYRKELGENIAVSASDDLDSMLKGIVNSWNDEGKSYNLETKTCVTGKLCNHYTQLVWQSTYEIGCGRSNCSAVGTFNFPSHVFVCNYREAGNTVILEPGSSTFVPVAPYKQGKPCSECEEGYTCSENLCTKVKEIDPTKDIDQDACYQQNKKMVDAYNERMRIYEEVDLKRWRKNLDEYEETIQNEE